MNVELKRHVKLLYFIRSARQFHHTVSNTNIKFNDFVIEPVKIRDITAYCTETDETL